MMDDMDKMDGMDAMDRMDEMDRMDWVDELVELGSAWRRCAKPSGAETGRYGYFRDWERVLWRRSVKPPSARNVLDWALSCLSRRLHATVIRARAPLAVISG